MTTAKQWEIKAEMKDQQKRRGNANAQPCCLGGMCPGSGWLYFCMSLYLLRITEVGLVGANKGVGEDLVLLEKDFSTGGVGQSGGRV